MECPECGSSDIDVVPDVGYYLGSDFECQECGFDGRREDFESYDEPDYDDTPPDFGPPGSGAVITEYTGFEPGLWPEEPGDF